MGEDFDMHSLCTKMLTQETYEDSGYLETAGFRERLNSSVMEDGETTHTYPACLP